MSDFNEGSDFSYLIIVFAVVAHLSIIAIVLYFACCRKCECRVIMLNKIFQNSASNAQNSVEINENDVASSQTFRLVRGHGDTRSAQPEIIGRQVSLLARIRANRDHNFPIEDSQLPVHRAENVLLSYQESQATGVGYTNIGANFECEVDLPSYDDYIRQQTKRYTHTDTGHLAQPEPPPYEEVIANAPSCLTR